MDKMKIVSLLAVTAGYTVGTDAAIIALTADDSAGGFTTSTPGLVDTPVEGVEPGAGTNDNLWGFDSNNGQAVYGIGNEAGLAGQVWVSRADSGEDAPELTTTISGLDSGEQYNIYLYQVVIGDWGLNAGVTGFVASDLYTAGEGTELENNGSHSFERVLLGTVTGVTSADVVIDDGSDRGFYKGVGVEVVPEPGSLALLGLGGLCLLRRRRG